MTAALISGFWLSIASTMFIADPVPITIMSYSFK
jgi:hypothetical protein